MPERGGRGRSAAPPSFNGALGDLQKRLISTLVALKRNRAARNRHQATRARHDMRDWQMERRQRTRHLIELGGLSEGRGKQNRLRNGDKISS